MIRIGDSMSMTRTFGVEDLALARRFAAKPAGDSVPLALLFSLFSCLLGEHLPGPGTCYLKQTGVMLRAAPLGSALTATVTVSRLRPQKNLVDLHTVCRDDNHLIYCEGRALVLAAHAFDADHA